MKKIILSYFIILLLGTKALISTGFAEKYYLEIRDQYLNSEQAFFDEQNNQLFLDQYEGTNILLVFWATWSGNSADNLPMLDNLQKDFRKLPFKILPISIDYQGVEVIKEYFAKYQIRHLEVLHDYRHQLYQELAVKSLPVAFFIDAEGKNKLLFRGFVKWYDDEIRKQLLAAMEGNYALPKNTYKFPSLNRNIMLNNQSKKTEHEKQSSN